MEHEINVEAIGGTRWAVFGGPPFEQDFHVCPVFGREHELEDSCWCHPERDANQPNFVVHNIEQ